MMTWTEILSAVGEALGQIAIPEPASTQLASEFIAALVCCEVATGRLPDQMALTVNDSLVANYWGTAGHGVLDVCPQDEDEADDYGRLAIATVLMTEDQPGVVDVHLRDALAGDEFREMATRIGEWCTVSLPRATIAAYSSTAPIVL